MARSATSKIGSDAEAYRSVKSVFSSTARHASAMSSAVCLTSARLTISHGECM